MIKEKVEAKHELLTRHEAAAYLRLSVSQVDNLSRAKELKRVKFGEGPRSRVLYRLTDLQAYVDAHVA